jgi:hypothetical protein
MMGRRVLYIVAVLLVVGAAFYLGHNRYDKKRSGASGDVFSTDSTGQTKPLQEEPPARKNPETAAPIPNDHAEQTAPDQTQPILADRTPTGQGQTPQAPATDSISPDPPNGMIFSGSGKFQLYRQGNLTWRLNTETGQNCVLFATDEEWKKPKVYRAGCKFAK